ncbi:MAG: UvrD-helicase domain-containing protein [bacterium]|nr:UvrD-helicase domain-containing protein [bacterium]
MHDKICGYELDDQQKQIVLDDSKYLLVVAGAGSGKTFTILGKIYYFIHYLNVDPKEILCISFTRATVTSLKEKIKKEFSFDMTVYTFHQLALEILKQGNRCFSITASDTLENMIHMFFSVTILEYPAFMKMVLQYFHIKKYQNILPFYQKFYQSHYHDIEMLERLILSFIHLFKCNGFVLKDFSSLLKMIKRTIFYSTYQKEKNFLILTLNIYLQYQKYLLENQEIDFDDMVIQATSLVLEEGIPGKWKYIIIDEYQDTSLIRFQLIQAILKQTSASLMVVGDDFQSIYRFTGCDLSLFLNFCDYFDKANIMKIENTYRNSQELIKVAGDFVMRNKKQIHKDLRSSKRLEKPIQIIYYKDLGDTFVKLVKEIYRNSHQAILVLGRNNKDIQMIMHDNIHIKSDGRIVLLDDVDICISYMTVHKSKGLEEENVIVIHLENHLLGFPNQIRNDKILRLVSHSFDFYPYSEERRLFYVALTRTKNYVYLLVPRRNPSIFVLELIKKHRKQIEVRTID